MTNKDRALNYVALFNHYDATGANWEHNVPLDADVRGDTVWLGGWQLRRIDGQWKTSPDGSEWVSARFVKAGESR